MFSTQLAFFGAPSSGSGPTNALVPTDIATDPNNPAQDSKLINAKQLREALNGASLVFTDRVFGEASAALGSAAVVDQFKILRTVARDVSYKADGTTWAVSADPVPGTPAARCRLESINDSIEWNGTRWGDGRFTDLQLITAGADRSIDSTYADTWGIDPQLASGARRVITITGGAEMVTIDHTGSAGQIDVQPAPTPIILSAGDGAELTLGVGGYQWI